MNVSLIPYEGLTESGTSGLTLAYLSARAKTSVNKLHEAATSYTSAAAQCRLYRRIEPLLSKHEIEIYKRGRNTHSRAPKNASVMEYRVATGFEALVGHLYIMGAVGRLDELMRYILSDTVGTNEQN